MFSYLPRQQRNTGWENGSGRFQAGLLLCSEGQDGSVHSIANLYLRNLQGTHLLGGNKVIKSAITCAVQSSLIPDLVCAHTGS